jgi:hypothetical protein
MTQEEAKMAIQDIPVGSRIQLIKKNGDIIEVVLASHSVEGVAERNYDVVDVPELPPALTVTSRIRFGKFRIDIDELINVAWIE